MTHDALLTLSGACACVKWNPQQYASGSSDAMLASWLRVQASALNATPLELVVLRAAPDDSTPARHALTCPKDAPGSTFAFLVLRLPSDCGAGAMTVTCSHQEIEVYGTCGSELDDFGISYAAAFSDARCTLECEIPGHAAFVVYTLSSPNVRFQPSSSCAWPSLPPWVCR